MHKQLRPQQVEMLVSNGAVRNEFANKVKELDRRLKMNGLDYKGWDTLTDHQHEIFVDNLFLDAECASSPEHYVNGAVKSCGCPNTVEDLHHHSPVLMSHIEAQQEAAPDMTVHIGESLDSVLDTLIEQTISEAATRGVAHEDKMGKKLVNLETGDTLTLVDFKHILRGAGDTKEDLFAAVQSVVDTATPPIPISYISHDSADQLRSNNKVGVVVVALRIRLLVQPCGRVIDKLPLRVRRRLPEVPDSKRAQRNPNNS